MKLIIDMPKEEYERFKKNQKKEYSESMLDVNIIANGTPIPDNATVCDIEQIRDEIEQARFIDKNTKTCKNALASGLEAALQIIDKYKYR